MRGHPSAGLAVLLAGWLCGGSVVLRGQEGGRDATVAREQWLLGYLKVEQAAAATREQRLALARQLYSDALAQFEEVGRRYPAWNPDLVSYRISHCREQIRRIDDAVANALDTMSRPELAAEVRRLREQRQGLDVQAQQLAVRSEGLQADLDAALREQRNAAAEAGRLSQELTEAREREAALQRRLDAVAADLQAREADLARLQAAAGDSAALRASLADLGRQAESARHWQQEATTQAASSREVSARAGELAVTLDRARRETDAVRAERDSLARAAAESAGRAEAAEQDRRKAMAELSRAQARLDEACRRAEAMAAQRDEADGRARAAADRATASAREVEALREHVANLRTEVQALQPAAMAQLRDAHADAQRQLAEARDAAGRVRAELDAARAAEQRLVAEKEAALRTAQETALTAQRHRLELQQLQERAAKALAVGDRAAAETSFRQLLEQDPQDAAVAARLGALLADRGDAAGAEALLQVARRGQSDDPDVLLQLGLVLLRQGRSMAAAAALLPAATAAPQRAEIQHFLGVALVENGWRDGAEKTFGRALELDPKRADTAFCMAALLASAGPTRRAEAQRHYERALALGASRDANLDRYFAGGQ